MIDEACGLYYSYTIRDTKTGRIIKERGPTPSRSFLIAFAKYLFLKMCKTVDQTMDDTGSTSRTITESAEILLSEAANTTVNGIVVGTSSTAVALADVALGAQIAHGTSAGELQYSASVINEASSDATSTSLITTRDFANGSGGSVTIDELGIYAEIENTSWHFAIVRDVQNIVVSDGTTLTLNYIFKTVA